MNGADALNMRWRIRLKESVVTEPGRANMFDTSTFTGTVGALLFLAGPWVNLIGAWVVRSTGVELPPGYGTTLEIVAGGVLLKVVTRWHSGGRV